MNEDLRFPIGEFDKNIEVTPELKTKFLNDIEELPKLVRKAVENLRDEQLDTPYRPEGWSVRQVVHHIPESHWNSYIRFKLALTEDSPTIKPYYEDRWAKLGDNKMPIENSLNILESLHNRWIVLLNSMSDEDFERTLTHPESGEWTLLKMLALYSWHGRHHLAHITKLRERNGW
jgi:hypothetical protein